MATHLHNPIPSDLVPTVAQTARRRSAARRSPAVIGWSVFAATVVGVFLLTALSVLALTEVSVPAAVGFGLYCAFWLGIGFGTIFASALVFGHES